MYLGLLLNGFLDYKVTARTVAQSASRALGLLSPWWYAVQSLHKVV